MKFVIISIVLIIVGIFSIVMAILNKEGLVWDIRGVWNNPKLNKQERRILSLFAGAFCIVVGILLLAFYFNQ